MDDALLSAIVPAKEGYELMVVVAPHPSGGYRALCRQFPRNLEGDSMQFGHGKGETPIVAMMEAAAELRRILEGADAAQAPE